MLWKSVKPEDVASGFSLEEKVGLPIVDEDNRRPWKDKLKRVDEIVSAHVLDDHYRTFLERRHSHPKAEDINLHAEGTVDVHLLGGDL